jgi:hypothetical protein
MKTNLNTDDVNVIDETRLLSRFQRTKSFVLPAEPATSVDELIGEVSFWITWSASCCKIGLTNGPS